MVSNLENYADFNTLSLDEKKKMVINAIDKDLDNEFKRLDIKIYKPLTIKEKIVYLNEKFPKSSLFKTISQDLIKIMSVMQNHEIEIKVSKREQVPFEKRAGMTLYCNRLSIFPLYTYNYSNQIIRMEISDNIEYSNMAISLVDCFNNRFLVEQKANSKVMVLK